MENETLQTAEWAKFRDNILCIDNAERSIKMKNSDGTGDPLVCLDGFGADLIRFAAGEGVQTHVHEGDHILFVLLGEGILTFDGDASKLYPGLCYLVPGGVEHAIDASIDLVLIAIGNQHFPLDSNHRMSPSIMNKD